MNELIMIGSSVVLTFFAGMFLMLMLNHKFSLNYFKVKLSKGKKVLVFLKTKFGWISLVAKKEEKTLLWEHDKVQHITNVTSDDDISRFGVCEVAYINLDNAEVCLKPKVDGSFYPDGFDIVTFRNLLERAITRPNADGSQDIKKLCVIILILLVIAVLGLVLIYSRQGEILEKIGTIATGVVL